MIPQEPQAALRDSRIAAARFSLSFSEFIIIHLLMMIPITNLEQLINGQFAELPPCAGQAELGQRKLRILDLDDEDVNFDYKGCAAASGPRPKPHDFIKSN